MFYDYIDHGKPAGDLPSSLSLSFENNKNAIPEQLSLANRDHENTSKTETGYEE